LIIFLEYQLGAFDLLFFVVVWQEERLEEGLLSGVLSHVREKQLLPSNQLNFGVCKVVVVDAVFRELDGAACRIELLLRIVKVILMRNLILDHLRAGITALAANPIEEAKLLVKEVRRPGERVHGIAGLAVPQEFPDVQVGIDARLGNDAHSVHIKHEQVVRGECLLLLINEWKELNILPHIVQGLERQVDVMVLLSMLQLDQFSEGDDLCVFLEDDFVIAEEVVVFDDCDVLVHLDEGLVVVLAELFHVSI